MGSRIFGLNSLNLLKVVIEETDQDPLVRFTSPHEVRSLFGENGNKVLEFLLRRWQVCRDYDSTFPSAKYFT
jgi:hypothetical protein